MKLLPYPRVFIALVGTWLILNGSITPGQILLGVLVAAAACRAVVPLEPPATRARGIGTIFALLWLVIVDVIASNIAVLRLILGNRPARSAFVTIPLELTDPIGLAILATIVTATPGSAWIHHDSTRSRVTIHVLDTDDPAEWAAILKRNYERRLLEIFQ